MIPQSLQYTSYDLSLDPITVTQRRTRLTCVKLAGAISQAHSPFNWSWIVYNAVSRAALSKPFPSMV